MAILCVSAFAHADPEVLFKQGRELDAAGDHAGACAKFQQAYDESPKPGIEANLGSCAEREGNLTKAWQLYLSAAQKWGDDERAVALRAQAASVAKRATVVVLGVPDPGLDGLEITINGRHVEPAREVRELVAPGDITLTATATDRARWRRIEHGKAGDTIVVEVVLAEPPEHPTETEEPAPTTHRRKSRVYLSIGLGAAAIGAFVTSYFVAKGASDDYDAILANPAYCMNDACNDEGRRRVDDTQSRARLGTVIGIAGGALAVGAAVVFFTAPRDTVVTPVATSTSAGLSLMTRF